MVLGSSDSASGLLPMLTFAWSDILEHKEDSTASRSLLDGCRVLLKHKFASKRSNSLAKTEHVENPCASPCQCLWRTSRAAARVHLCFCAAFLSRRTLHAVFPKVSRET
eukprot:1254053-Amphidinium_carterae.1